MGLFVPETFTSHSGLELHWKIECDALTASDWECLAIMGASLVPPFRRVIGVPRGGWPFANALEQYVDETADMWLIVDDVWTTGASVIEFEKQFTAEERSTCNRLMAFNRSQAALPWRTYAILDVHNRITP